MSSLKPSAGLNQSGKIPLSDQKKGSNIFSVELTKKRATGMMMEERMLEGVKLAEEFLSTLKINFSDLKPSDLPAKPGV